MILDNWGFEYFILADESLEKASQNLKICVLVNNNL